MKINKVQKVNTRKKAIILVVLCYFIFSLFFVDVALADIYPDEFIGPIRETDVRESQVANLENVPVNSVEENIKLNAIKSQRYTIAENEYGERVFYKREHDAWAIAFKSALHYLLNTFAYDTATWLASGAKGQGPMHETESWGDYALNVLDGAAGTFVQQLGEDWLGGFNVCNPDFSFKLTLGLALDSSKYRRPSQPDCTVKELMNNWENFINDPNFMDRFVLNFDPRVNDIIIGIGMFNRYNDYTSSEVAAALGQRQENKGIKPILDTISDKILTPAEWVSEEAKVLIDKGHFEAEKVTTESIIGDAINTFTSTLAGKLIQRLFREGLAALRGGSQESGSRSSATRPDQDLYTGQSGQSLYSGRQAAEERFITFLDAGIVTSGPYETLQKLSICSNPKNPDPEECVIDQRFRIAIEQEMTVREAIQKGYLDGNAPFGFTPQGFQPPYNEGYPYRSLLILRAHRIIPVTWEIAALAIDKGLAGEETWTLNKIIAAYDVSPTPENPNPFYHLIDLNWVLKAPEHFCKAEGYGPEIISDTIVNDTRSVSRDRYCADYQSCIEKDAEGNCIYGYCTEERRIWDLQGQDCPDYYNTCQTFSNRTGEIASYLQNTLDYNSCSVDNVGCQWYCQAYNTIDGVWTCVNNGERVLKPCTQAGGCSLTAACDIPEGENFCNDQINNTNLVISSPCSSLSKWWDGNSCIISEGCTIDRGGVSCTKTGCENQANLVTNPSFETAPLAGAIAQGWTGDANFFERVSGATERVYSGRNSIRFYSWGQSGGLIMRSDPVSLAAGKTYSFSAHVFNNLNRGDITFTVSGDITGGSKTNTLGNQSQYKNRWVEINTPDFTASGANPTVTIIVTVGNASTQVSGTAWLDEFRISEECITNPVTLSLIGTIDQDQSKIHLDRDAQQCNAEADGCSQFIRLKPNLGTNIIPNSSFEDWPDTSLVPTGWTSTAVSKNTQDTVVGQLSLGLADSQSVEIAPTSILSATGYYLSFWAKADSQMNISVPEASYRRAGETADSVADFLVNDQGTLRIDTNWQRFVMDATTTPPDITNFRITFSNNVSDSNLLLDGIQLEPIDINGNYSAYSDYGANNSAYLRQAPDYLSCNGYTLSRPSPYVLDNVRLNQCVGETLVWRKACVGGSDAGKACDTTGDCADSAPCEPSGAGGCDATGNFCCHEIDPGECFSYAMSCEADEVGCDSFQPVKGGPAIPGVVAADDYCPAECVGYDAYKQSTTYFEKVESLEYFIPSTAAQCTASQKGCDEFTNLDEVAQGGEGRENYRYLRHCEKPSEASSCQNYYTWQGSDDTGYQLRVYNLVADDDGSPRLAISDPALWLDEWREAEDCNGPEDIVSNPFCKEFYGVDGQISYRIYANTVSCSDDCHPFRKTRLGESEAIAQANCQATNPAYDDTASPNPGWQNNACIYYAIPGQGIPCTAPGCREYRGNTGGNIFLALSDNFEDGDIFGWRFGQISNEALSVGGHSIKAQLQGSNKRIATTMGGDGTACDLDVVTQVCNSSSPSYPCYNPAIGKCIFEDATSHETCLANIGDTYCGVIDDRIQPDKTYLISFWGKSDPGNLEIKVRFWKETETNEKLIGTAFLAPDWNYYVFGPFTYEEVEPSSRLQFINESATVDTPNFYIDNIEIREISNYVYAVKNSWNTPVSCDTNPFTDPPQPSPQFMLGCKQYRDLSNRTHNLKSFNHLCREEAVGCEALVDTQNSSTPFEQEFNVNDSVGNIIVSDDEVTYLVNRPEFSCNVANKGCQRLGLPSINQDGNVTWYNDVYLLNNPDRYENEILCSSEEVGCEEFQTNRGFSYFKEPDSRTCEYRRITAPGRNDFGWFKTGSTAQLPDCPIVASPLGIIHPDPTEEWAGICPDEFSSCTEYVDPVSDISVNEVFNTDLAQDSNKDNQPDGWTASGSSQSQPLNLKDNTLYTLAAYSKSPVQLKITNCDGITSPDSSLRLADEIPVGGDGINDSATLILDSELDNYSGRFFVISDAECRVEIISSNNFETGNSVAGRETGVYYALADTVNQVGCNGLVNPVEGCVLFNDRSGINYKIGETDNSYLVFDADVSGPASNNSIPEPECFENCDSDRILKVKPDRTCGQWLSCSSQFKVTDSTGKSQDYCLEVAVCDQMNESGECISFPLDDRLRFDPSSNNQTADSPELIKNFSGFTSAGLVNGGINIRDGYYHYGLMSQEGEVATVSNGDFEIFNDAGRPLGWYLGNVIGSSWQPEIFKVISSPITAKDKEGVTIKDGVGILRFAAGADRSNILYQIKSEIFEVLSQSDYILSVSVNTANLKPPEAEVYIKIEGKTYGDTDFGSTLLGELKIKAGANWQDRLIKFNSGNYNIARVVISYRLSGGGAVDCADLGGDGKCDIDGASYLDNIRIAPALLVQAPTTVDLNGDGLADNQNLVGPSCRLYPKGDSLSCNYVGVEGIYRGWEGYCLLRDPKDPNICLQWWPVDLIKGSLLETTPGYTDRYPLYYCVASDFSSGTDQSKSVEFDVLEQVGGGIGSPAPNCKTFGDLPGAIGSLEEIGIAPAYREALSLGNIFSAKLNTAWRGGNTSCDIGIFNFKPISEADPITKTLFNVVSSSTSPIDFNFYLGVYTSGSTYCAGFIYFYEDESSTHNRGDLRGVKACAHDTGGWSDQDTHYFTFDLGILTGLADGIECNAIAQVVTPTGANKAWLNRVAEGSDFILHDIQTVYNSDYPPFGSIVAPADIYDPTTWDDDSNLDGFQRLTHSQPDKTNFQPPYQARAGAVLGCDGDTKPITDKIFSADPDTLDTCDLVGRCDQSGEHCIRYPFSNRSPRLLYITGDCPIEGEICRSLNFPNDPDILTAATNGKERLKRIFAQSYGLWEWQTNGAGACDTTNAKCSQTGVSCTNTNCSTTTGTCTVVTKIYRCVGGDLDGEVCDQSDEGDKCKFNNGNIDNASICTAIQKNSCSNNNDIICTDSSQCSLTSNQCLGKCQNDPSIACVPDGNGNSSNCSLDSRYVNVTASRPSWGPPAAGNLCSYLNRNIRPEAFCSAEIYGEKFSCTSSDVCGSGNSCTNEGRDYCAVAPVVANIKVSGSDGNVIVNRSASVNLSFNIIVDQAQAPVVSYKINWGNSTASVTGSSLRDKVNQDFPYFLSHTYSYYDLLRKNNDREFDKEIYCAEFDVAGAKIEETIDLGFEPSWYAAAAAVTVDPRQIAKYCISRPRIQVIDNWGWCNGNVVNGVPVSGAAYGYYGSACQNNINAWTYFPGYIIVGLTE